MNFRSRWFATLEFTLEADRPSRMFEHDDRSRYTVIGHDLRDCKAITEKRLAYATSLSDYLFDHENFDGELTFGDPWPCSRCIPTEKLPEIDLAESRTTVSESAPAPAGPATHQSPSGNDPATEGQIRKLMALYRRSKPQATKEQIKAAEDRAKGMTKKEASAVIDKMEKGEKPVEPHAPAPSPVGATSGIAKGSKVTDGTVTGKVFWTGTGKSGALRYGVAYRDADGNERKTFTEFGWTVVE
jgi:hypothetical protein